MKKCYLMKGLLLLAAGMFLCSVSMAQKKYFLGGGLGFNSINNDGLMRDPAGNYTVVNTKTRAFNISPEFGFFLNDKTALGIRLSYANNVTRVDGGDITNPSYSVSPFVRFIIPLWTSRFSIYNDLGIYGTYWKATTYLEGSRETKATSLGAFYRPGIQFRLKENINLLASFGNLLNYDYTSQKHHYHSSPTPTTPMPDMKNSAHSFGITSNYGINSFQLGVNFLF